MNRFEATVLTMLTVAAPLGAADAAATAVFGLPADAARRLARRVLTDADVIPLA